jgi:tetratricopeptide (TPR) repeat protein
MMETTPFSVNLLQDEAQRREVVRQLEGRTWVMHVDHTKENYGFLYHSDFDAVVYVSEREFPDLVLFKPGDPVKVKVSVVLDSKKSCYGFRAMPPLLRKNVLYDPSNAALRRAVANHGKRPFPFEATSPDICIFMDERWPSLEDGAAECYHGIAVISGVVWNGAEPDQTCLPLIPDHLRDLPQMVSAFTALFSCDKVFPFLFQFQTHKSDPKSEYAKLVRVAIKILLGWLVRRNAASGQRVRIVLENFGKYSGNLDRKDFFEGIFTEAAESLPQRFKPWSFQEVIWCDKAACGDGYVPYADLVAALVKSPSPGREELAATISPNRLPGYVPVSTGLLPRLAAFDQLHNGSIEVEQVFDLLNELRGTFLGNHLLASLQKKLQRFPMLSDRMVDSLEARYLAKERDLTVLRRLVAEIGSVVGAPKNLRTRSRFIWHLISLQDANHHGDPRRAAKDLELFESLRDAVAPSDPGLAADADLNLIVHLNDQFRFLEALRLNRRLAEMKAHLPRQSAARALSSLGQCNSLCGHHAEAEECFAAAIGAFEAESGLGFDMRGEIDQTSVYRAINSIDGNFGNAGELVERVLGPVLKAVQNLVGESARQSFHHHLLVRALWFGVLPQPAKEAYLAGEKNWQAGDGRHPWELIALYRALLLNGGTNSNEWFTTAVDIASEETHGATLAMIGAIAATVAFCRQRDEWFKEKAIALAGKAAAVLPEAGSMIKELHRHLETPSERGGDEVLRLLPFNYH